MVTHCPRAGGSTVSRDELKGAAEGERSAESRWRDALADYAPRWVLWSDRDGRCLSVSPALADLLSRPASSLIGKPASECGLGGPALWETLLQRVAQDGEPATACFDFPAPDGRLLQLQATLSRAPEGAGAGALVALIQDVTAIWRTWDELEQANEQLVEARRDHDRFLINVSHELRTPLAVIKNIGTIISRGYAGPLTADLERFSAMLLKESARLRALVDELLDYQKLSVSDFQTRLRVASLQPVIQEVAESFEPVLKEKRLTLALELDPQPLSAAIDRARLGQVLLNLLSNAAKFTPAGGQVIVRLERHGPEIHLSVQDTGIGIPAADLDRVFQEFYRIEGEAHDAIPGAGLGLAICRQLIESGHSGRIWARSEPGQGSLFTVALPAAEPPAGPA